MKADIETKTAAVRAALKGTDVAAMKSTMQALSDAVQKAGSAVYGQPGQAGGSPGRSRAATSRVTKVP